MKNPDFKKSKPTKSKQQATLIRSKKMKNPDLKSQKPTKSSGQKKQYKWQIYFSSENKRQIHISEKNKRFKMFKSVDSEHLDSTLASTSNTFAASI